MVDYNIHNDFVGVSALDENGIKVVRDFDRLTDEERMILINGVIEFNRWSVKDKIRVSSTAENTLIYYFMDGVSWTDDGWNQLDDNSWGDMKEISHFDDPSIHYNSDQSKAAKIRDYLTKNNLNWDDYVILSDIEKDYIMTHALGEM